MLLEKYIKGEAYANYRSNVEKIWYYNIRR
jgi:hypothetical protein